MIFIGKGDGPSHVGEMEEGEVRRVVEQECNSIYIEWRGAHDGSRIYSEIIRLTKADQQLHVRSRLENDSRCFGCVLI